MSVISAYTARVKGRQELRRIVAGLLATDTVDWCMSRRCHNDPEYFEISVAGRHNALLNNLIDEEHKNANASEN